MANMYNLIAELCAEKGVNVTQMSRETGIPRSGGGGGPPGAGVEQRGRCVF